MAPPNEPVDPIRNLFHSTSSEQYFYLSDGKLSVKGVPLLSEVPSNVTLSLFHLICQPSSTDVPSHLVQRVRALSHKAGFNKEEPSDKLTNSLGRFSNRDFLGIFRFKPWWSTCGPVWEFWVRFAGGNTMAEEYVVYLNQADELLHMTLKSDPFQITIKPSSFEIFTSVVSTNNKFAPIGPKNMFNSGGAVQELEYNTSLVSCSVKMKVKGVGNFLSYLSESPKKCCLNGVEVAFGWSANEKLTLNLPWVEEAAGVSDVVLEF